MTDWGAAARGSEPMPIEEREGYLGTVWDGILTPGPGLEPLGEFPWLDYNELCANAGMLRRLVVPLADAAWLLTHEPGADLAPLLDQLPAIEADDAIGLPGGGGGRDLWRTPGADATQVAAEVTALVAALERDIEDLLDELVPIAGAPRPGRA